MRISDYAEMLLSGTSGKSVVDIMVSEIENMCSIRVAMTSVRNTILNGSDSRRFHTKHGTIINEMKRASQSASIEAKRKFRLFLSGNLKYRYDAKRKVRKDDTYFGDDALDDLLYNIEIFPDNMKSFVLPKDIAKACQEIAKHNLQVANENVKIIKNATKTINQCIDYIELAVEEGSKRNSDVSISDKRLGICLLLMSGRRTSEIFNGKSIFRKGSKVTSVHFKGQVKKNNAGQETTDTSYEIPLLCDAMLFIDGFNALRKLQGYKKFTNKQVNSKYSTNLQYWTKILFPLPPSKNSVPNIIGPHDLRRIYVVAVFDMYNYATTSIGINTMAKKILGHEYIDTSVNYLSIRLNGLTEEFPDTYRLDLSSGQKRIKRAKRN